MISRVGSGYAIPTAAKVESASYHNSFRSTHLLQRLLGAFLEIPLGKDGQGKLSVNRKINANWNTHRTVENHGRCALTVGKVLGCTFVRRLYRACYCWP